MQIYNNRVKKGQHGNKVTLQYETDWGKRSLKH